MTETDPLAPITPHDVSHLAPKTAPHEYGPDDWPRCVEDATADRVARHLTQAATYTAGEMDAILPRLMAKPKVDWTHPDARLYSALTSAYVAKFGVAYLLRQVAEKHPELADELAADYYDACEDGATPSELLWEWGVAYGQDPQAMHDAGGRDAR